nr:hypothetical protein [Tanacetum cinerariifolium]
MIDQALLQKSTNGDGSHNLHEDNRRNVQTARPCFYAEFMKCQPLNFKGTEGVEVLKKKMTNKYCPQGEIKKLEIELWNLKIDKYISGLTDNIYGSVKSSKPKTLDETIELANDFMDQKLRTYAERQTNNKRKADDLYRNNHGHQQQPVKRLEIGLSPTESTRTRCSKDSIQNSVWTLRVLDSVQAMVDQDLLQNSNNGDGSHSSHEDNRRNVQTTRPYFYADFMKCQPLNFKGTEDVFVANETEKIDKYISGLPDNIYRSVKSSKPKTLDEIIELANDFMDQKLRTYVECQTNKRKANDLSRKPWTLTTTRQEAECRQGLQYGIRSSGNANVVNAHRDNRAIPKGNGCFECRASGHFKRDCPKLKNKDGGNDGSCRSGAEVAGSGSSSGPVLYEMTPATISSGLVPNLTSSAPFVPPVDHPAPEVISPIAEVVSLEPTESTRSPSSTTFDQDAPSPSNSQTTPKTQPPVIPNDVEEDNHDIEVAHMGNDPYFGILIPEVPSDQSSSSDIIHTIMHLDHQIFKHNSKWTKDHLLENIISELARPVSTRLQLHEQTLFCYYDAFLTSVEPRRIKML